MLTKALSFMDAVNEVATSKQIHGIPCELSFRWTTDDTCIPEDEGLGAELTANRNLGLLNHGAPFLTGNFTKFSSSH